MLADNVKNVCKHDPAAMLGGVLATPIVTHHAAVLEPHQVGEVLRSIDEYAGSIVVKIAMQPLPHMVLGRGELRQGKWTEVDFDEAVWRNPAERTKLRRLHSGPLRLRHSATGRASSLDRRRRRARAGLDPLTQRRERLRHLLHGEAAMRQAIQSAQRQGFAHIGQRKLREPLR